MRLEKTGTSLKGFNKGRLTPLGVVELPVTIDTNPFKQTMMLAFVVVDEVSLYQIIFNMPFLRISKVVVSNHYLPLKYRVNDVVGVVEEA